MATQDFRKGGLNVKGLRSAQNFGPRSHAHYLNHVAGVSQASRAATPYVPRGAHSLEVGERFVRKVTAL